MSLSSTIDKTEKPTKAAVEVKYLPLNTRVELI
jgi:hypothetical protein